MTKNNVVFCEFITSLFHRLSTLYLVENAGIERLPEVGWFRGFRHLDFSLDNSPALCAQWQAIVEAEPQIRASVRWNKIWPDSVLDGIFLGSLRTAQNSEVFSSLNITHVLTCGRNMKTKVPEVCLQECSSHGMLPCRENVFTKWKLNFLTFFFGVESAYEFIKKK